MKWEYLRYRSPSDKKLGLLGVEGWELVAIDSHSGDGSLGGVSLWIFKRLISEVAWTPPIEDEVEKKPDIKFPTITSNGA